MDIDEGVKSEKERRAAAWPAMTMGQLSIFIWLKDDLRRDLVSIPVNYSHIETNNDADYGVELSYGAKNSAQ